MSSFKVYPNSTAVDGSYTAEEVRRGFTWLNTDVECPHCHKLQPVAATGYIGGPCVRCGEPTGSTCGSTHDVEEN